MENHSTANEHSQSNSSGQPTFHAMGNTQTDLPPDVLKSRREISSRDIRSFTHSSRNPNEGPPSLQGIGLYTHAVPTSQILEFRDGEYRRPLPRFIGPLPTNGPTRRIREVQEDVKAAYEKLQAVLHEEQRLAVDAGEAKERFGALPDPGLQARQAQNGKHDANMSAMNEKTGNDAMNGVETAPLPVDLAGRLSSFELSDRRQPGDASRSMSMPGSSVGSTLPSRSLTMPGGEISAGPALMPNSNGSTYDAERDPRRRGR